MDTTSGFISNISHTIGVEVTNFFIQLIHLITFEESIIVLCQVSMIGFELNIVKQADSVLLYLA